MLYPDRLFEVGSVVDFLSFPAQFGLQTVWHEMLFVSGFDGSLTLPSRELIKAVSESVDVFAIKEDSRMTM